MAAMVITRPMVVDEVTVTSAAGSAVVAVVHYYNIHNGGGQNGLMEVGIATASDQRPRLIEA
jgi:hypothetical protein